MEDSSVFSPFSCLLRYALLHPFHVERKCFREALGPASVSIGMETHHGWHSVLWAWAPGAGGKCSELLNYGPSRLLNNQRLKLQPKSGALFQVLTCELTGSSEQPYAAGNTFSASPAVQESWDLPEATQLAGGDLGFGLRQCVPRGAS